jgi:hypothetical protein
MDETRRGLAGWSAATVLVSAFLLFQVQPMVSKMILPWFGGSPSVWTVCMLFFQAFLLAGYSYAHALERLPRTRVAGMIHCLLLVSAAAVLALLPILPAPSWKPPDSREPQLRILLLLATHVGLPYFLLSASAPLVQAWYSRASGGRVPYRYYALSNVGSLSALLSYPFVIEPAFDLQSQSRLWSLGFFAFALLSGGLALAMTRWNLPAAHLASTDADNAAPTATPWTRFALWLLLPAFSTMSLLAMTNQICQDVAVVPFLWIAPLSLYLLTFIICFDAERWYRRGLMAVATLAVLFLMVAISMPERFNPWLHRFGYSGDMPDFSDNLVLESGFYLASLFLICMVCHGELVRSKPGARHLTLFYLMIAAGGVLGGLFVALVCPRIFNGLIEVYISLVGGGVLALVILLRVWWRRERCWSRWWLTLVRFPGLITRDLALVTTRRGRGAGAAVRERQVSRAAEILWRRRKWWTLWSALAPLPLLVAAFFIAPDPRHLVSTDNHVIVARRNFYGVLTVKELGERDSDDFRHNLYNGRILHGVQFLQPEWRRTPTTYYVPESGVGLALLHLAVNGPLRVATVGLGTGTIAAYGQEGDYYCFYEINPEVEQIAREYFTYVSDCPARVEVKLGDARLSMEQEETSQQYDVIALDAFSGDAIPAHLLTIEAFEVYLRHLQPLGVIAVHTSNRHLDLPPIVTLIAQHYQMKVIRIYVTKDAGVGESASEWLLVTNNEEFLNQQDVLNHTTFVGAPDPSIRVWTDQYSNLFQILTARTEWQATWARWRAKLGFGDAPAAEENDEP